MLRDLVLCLLMLTVPFPLLPGAETIISPVAGNFSAAIPDAAGHTTPAIEFLRRFERVVRQLGRFETTAGSLELLVTPDEKIPPGTTHLAYDERLRQHVLRLPLDYRQWVYFPAVGRALTAALLQARMGVAPTTPLPENSLWVADGLWAEFVQREADGKRIFRFTWLPGLRQIVETGGVLTLDETTLLPPLTIRRGAADWELYTERARLALEVVLRLNPNAKDNLLKEYCFLAADNRLSPQVCFERSFGAAARQRLARLPGGTPPTAADPTAAGRAAMEKLAMRTLFNNYTPLAAASVEKYLAAIDQVRYKRSADGFEATAALADLPNLVDRYETCTSIPRLKILELNDLAALSPAELRGGIFGITAALATIGEDSPARAATRIKEAQRSMQLKINEFKHIEQYLAECERTVTPLLYEYRFALEPPPRRAPLPPQTAAFLNAADHAGDR